MSATDPSARSRHAPEQDQREAPSAIINACHSLVKWHLLLGVFCLLLAGLVPWRVYQFSENVRLMNQYYRVPETTVPDSIAVFAAVCGLFMLSIAAVLFRCASGMRAFAENRRIVGLHRAVCRLRTVWRVFSISLALAVFTIAGALILRLFLTSQ